MRYYKAAIVFIFIMTLMISGCRVENSSTSQNVSVPNISFSDFKIEQREDILLSDPIHIPFDQVPGSPKSIMASYEDKLLIESFGNQEMYYYEYNFTTKKCVPIGSTPLLELGSGSFVMTDSNEVITSFAFEGKKKNTLIKINTEKKRIDQLEHFDWWPPFQYYALVDQDTLLMFGPKLLASHGEEKYSYYIDRYSLSKKSYRTLIDIPDSSKQGVSCFYYANQRIYTYQFDVESNTVNYYIQSYTLDGKRAERYDMNECIPEGDTVSDLIVFENYFFLWTLNGSFIILQHDSASQKIQMIETDTHVTFKQSPKMVLNNFGCLYDRKDHILMRYDHANHCFVKQKVNLDKDDVFQNFWINENGTIIICIANETNPDNQERYFVVSALS